MKFCCLFNGKEQVISEIASKNFWYILEVKRDLIAPCQECGSNQIRVTFFRGDVSEKKSGDVYYCPNKLCSANDEEVWPCIEMYLESYSGFIG